MTKFTVREWIEEALDLLMQPELVYTNRERRADVIESGCKILEVLKPREYYTNRGTVLSSHDAGTIDGDDYE